MHRAIFYEWPHVGRAPERLTHSAQAGEVTITLVGTPAEVPPLAAQLVAAGAGIIELCGGMPLATRVEVMRAVPAGTRVASVNFGIESIVKAAQFNRAYLDGHPPAEACLILAPGADPEIDRFVRSGGWQNITFAFVTEDAAADVAGQLAAQGVGLIELYGGFPDQVVVDVFEAVAGRAAVGVSGFGHQSTSRSD